MQSSCSALTHAHSSGVPKLQDECPHAPRLPGSLARGGRAGEPRRERVDGRQAAHPGNQSPLACAVTAERLLPAGHASHELALHEQT